MKTKWFIIISSLVIGSIACVPLKQHRDLESRSRELSRDMSSLQGRNHDLETSNTELKSRIEHLEGQVKDCEDEQYQAGKQKSIVEEKLKRLQRSYDNLMRIQNELTSGSERETGRILEELQRAQRDLLLKEDSLMAYESELRKEKDNLDLLSAELAEQNAKLIELQSILDRKDSVVHALKNKVTDALYNFGSDELRVELKNGKVYVSLEEKLLFRSGSYSVDPKGVSALKKLGVVLGKNPDINILIEGHTDNVPYRSSNALQDNWDLSVKRATSIVRILLENTQIDPERLMAAGRGEFLPIDPSDTPEARQKNRRTEIILTPKLDELLKILE